LSFAFNDSYCNRQSSTYTGLLQANSLESNTVLPSTSPQSALVSQGNTTSTSYVVQGTSSTREELTIEVQIGNLSGIATVDLFPSPTPNTIVGTALYTNNSSNLSSINMFSPTATNTLYSGHGHVTKAHVRLQSLVGIVGTALQFLFVLIL
jgi:hypothetical protein